MFRTILRAALAWVLAVTGAAGMAQDLATDDRSVLPVTQKPFAGTIGRDFTDSTPAFRQVVAAPPGAPNVLVVLTDDVGFAASSTFGGPVPTPALDRLARSGLRYTRFHTTAMCSPTRASLLTGRNAHAVGTGIVTDTASGYPGYWSIIPRSAATVAEILRLNGYNTAFFGKHHNVPQGREDHTIGPFEHWPTGLGFEHFYGFLGGDTDQFKPRLYRGTTPVALETDGETLDFYLAEELLGWLHKQEAADPAKPFFAYLAPGTAHAPHQAPAEWIDRFKGRFDGGWDALRRASLARQKAAGLAPADTVLTPRPAEIPPWDALSPDEQAIAARTMEAFAGMLAYQDHQLGRILDELDRMGQRDDTLIIFIQGDNGGSAEGGLAGTMNELGHLANGMREDTAWLYSQIDEIGGPNSYGLFPVGWSWATNTPFQWTKQVGSHLGGLRNGMVISWPERIADAGGIRTQFGHVNDILPTILEAAGLPIPTEVNGVAQQPVDGTSLVYSFADAAAPERHTRQYFEMIGNVAIYDNGWLANTTPGRLPWVMGGSGGVPGDYAWELYDLSRDFSQSRDLAAEMPIRLDAMKQLFEAEATANNVYPLDDRQGRARAGGNLAALFPNRVRYDYWASGISVAQSKAPPINFLGFTVTAEIDVPEGGATGALIASGSQFAGWTFYLDAGKPVVIHRASQKPEDRYAVASEWALPPGRHTIRFDYELLGPPGQGGIMTIFENDLEVARAAIGRTAFIAAPLGETFDIGRDTGVPVIDYGGDSAFTGRIERITIVPKRPTGIGAM